LGRMYLAHPVFRHDVIVTPKLVIVNTKLHYRSAAQLQSAGASRPPPLFQNRA
jgi:hypothetical protein